MLYIEDVCGLFQVVIMGNASAKPRCSAQPEIRNFFYEQTSFNTRGKRYKKQPEELPEDLRYAHMNPKLAAMLLSNDKAKEKEQAAETFDDGLGDKSLLNEISEKVATLKDRFDSMMILPEAEGDIINPVFCAARKESEDLLFALALYLYRNLYVPLPRSLEFNLTCTFRDFVGVVFVEPKEWQLFSNKQEALREILAQEEKEKNMSQTAVDSRPGTSISHTRTTTDDRMESVAGSRDDRSVMSRPKSKPPGSRSLLLAEISEANEKEKCKRPSVPRLLKVTGPNDKVLAVKKDKAAKPQTLLGMYSEGSCYMSLFYWLV